MLPKQACHQELIAAYRWVAVPEVYEMFLFVLRTSRQTRPTEAGSKLQELMWASVRPKRQRCLLLALTRRGKGQRQKLQRQQKQAMVMYPEEARRRARTCPSLADSLQCSILLYHERLTMRAVMRLKGGVQRTQVGTKER